MAVEKDGGIEFYVDVDTSEAITSTKNIETQNKKLEKSFKGVDTQVTRTSKAVRSGLSGISRGAGQAGIQLQQFIGQIQGGQSAMLALSQQSADLGFVLGAPLLGAVVGISASIAGIFLPTLFDSGKAVDELTEKLEKWKDTIGLTREQADFLINKEKEANLERSKTIAKYTEEINVLKQQAQNQKIALEGFDLTEKARKKLLKAQEDTNKELTQSTALLQAETRAIIESGEKISIYEGAVTQSVEKTKEQNEALKDTEESITSQIRTLEAQIIALEQGEEAAFRYVTAQQLGLAVGEQIPANIDRQIQKLFELRQAQEEAEAAERKRTKDQRGLDSLERRTANLGLTDEEQVREQLARDLELLNQAQEAKIESEKSYEERRIELRRQAEERIKSINEKASRDSLVNFEALENQVIGTFASMVSGAQSGKDAIRSLAQSVLTQMVGALIKMGIQAAVGQTAAVATGTAAATTLSAAYATPAALASLASFGANAAPAQTGIATTVGLAQSLSLAGARENGGPVSGGKLYEVGERNKPELLQSGGRQFMIPGNNGKVISNADLQGEGSQNVQVIINNLPGQTAAVTESQSDDGRMRQIAIQVVNEQSSQLGSKMNQNINKNHNVTNRQGGNRRN